MADLTPDLVRRQLATEKTLVRYRGKAFDWGKGITCVHLARTHLKNMGHKPPTIPRFRSIHGAKQAMKDRGWADVGDMLDSLLPRIAPAQMLLGDLAIVPGEGMDAMLICGGPIRLFGWHGSEARPVFIGVDLGEITAAWRV